MSKRVPIGGNMDFNQFMQGYNQKMVDRPSYCSICGQDTKQATIHSSNDPAERRLEVQYGKHKSCAIRQQYQQNY